MKSMSFFAVCLLVLSLMVPMTASAADVWVAVTIDENYMGYGVTSTVSAMDAEQQVVAQCGNTQMCREQVESIANGCISYAESVEAWGMGWDTASQVAIDGALSACNQYSQAPCTTTNTWCSQ